MNYWYSQKELRKKAKILHEFLHKCNKDNKEEQNHELVYWDMMIAYFDMRFEDLEKKIDKLAGKKLKQQIQEEKK